MAKTKEIDESCKKILSGVNASLLTLTISLTILGLVFKFGISVIENHIKSWFDEYVMSLRVAREEDLGLENYDLTKLASGISIVFISLGLSSSVLAVLGLLASKMDVFQIAVVYSVLLGLVMLTEIAFVLIISVQRGLMDCCGVDDYTSFNGAVTWNRRLFQDGWWFTLSSPVLCCKLGAKVPGDYSCAVNPSDKSSNHLHGCYEAVWSVMRNYRSYFIFGGSVIFLVQGVLLFAAIVRTRAVFQLSRNKAKRKDNTVQSKPENGQKSINDLIFSTAGMFGRPTVHSEFRMDPGTSDNWYGQSNVQENRHRPSMTFIPSPGQSALNHLLHQCYLQERFSHPADLFNPLNIFTAPFPNSFTNGRYDPFSTARGDPYNNSRLDNRFGDIGGIIQPFTSPSPGLPQIQAWNTGIMRLTDQYPIRGLPELEIGTPESVRRECDSSGCVCERNCGPITDTRRNSKDIED